MKIAYLMLVHKNPLIMKRAIAMLSSEDCAFFIHVDWRVDIREFSSAEGDKVIFCKQRIPVYWGEFSQVEATMRLVRHALADPAEFDYFVLFQGSDYPLRNGNYIRAFLTNNRGAEFMSLVKMPAPGYPLNKINTLRYPSHKPVRRAALRVLAKLGLGQRDYRQHLDRLQAYAGHACWTLSRAACRYIVTFSAAHPHFEDYFRNAFTSDEMFFHTILGNSPFRLHVRKSLTYTDWPTPGNHPRLLTDEHVKFFEAQEKVWIEDEWGAGEVLFARKFCDDQIELLDRMDEMIRQKDELGAPSIPSSEITK